METLVTAGQLILSLSILIVLHELGHFVPAKLFNTRVEKFYLFFDPWFELFKIKKGETEYGIGWLPLGGYVKIAGMIDESMDTEQMKQPPQPWEFRSKPAWQRLIIMLGGVTVNFVLGLFLYGMVLWYYGEDYLAPEDAVYGISVDSLGMEMGLQDGDIPVAVDTLRYRKMADQTLKKAIIIDNAQTFTVRRDGREVVLPIDSKLSKVVSSRANKDKIIFTTRTPFTVYETREGYPADSADFERDDVVISVDGMPTPYFLDFAKALRTKKGERIDVGVLRSGDTVTVSTGVGQDGRTGLTAYPDTLYFDYTHVDYSLLSALPAGATRGWSALTDQFKAFGQMFQGNIKASDSLGGIGSIASLYGGTWDWQRFWSMTALLSLILAFMNLLPIPALDGGHVMFLLYEVVTGRKPSDKFMEVATLVGFILVIGLMLYANGLDVWRWITGKF